MDGSSFFKMLAKNNISFLLNPVDHAAARASLAAEPRTPPTVPCTPPSAPFQHKALCPATLAATSLALLSAVCMSPMTERKATTSSEMLKKRKFCEAITSFVHTDSSEEMEDEEAESSCCESEDSSVKPSAKKKPRTPPCQVEGCKNMAVSRGCCVRHGGGSRCVVAGCSNRAKLYKRCFQHGGYKTCQAANCSRKAKRYGYCWSHGGGRICEIDGCTKVSTQGGLCWAHGGGNRCRLEGCSRRSYQKYDYYCVDHADHSKSTTSGDA